MTAYAAAERTGMKRLTELLYPELRSIPKGERDQVRKRARQTPFDLVELLGMAVGLVAVTAITRYSVDGLGIGERVLWALGNFMIAIPLLAVALGPFLVRRTRRGLRAEIEKRRSASGQ